MKVACRGEERKGKKDGGGKECREISILNLIASPRKKNVVRPGYLDQPVWRGATSHGGAFVPISLTLIVPTLHSSTQALPLRHVRKTFVQHSCQEGTATRPLGQHPS